MKRFTGIAFLFLLFVCMSSCENKKPESHFETIANKDSIAAADSIKDVDVILKQITTVTFPQFSNTKPTFVSRDTSEIIVMFSDSLVNLKQVYYSNLKIKYSQVDFVNENISRIYEGTEDGKVKMCGDQLTGSQTKIGVWQYADSIVDYDKKYMYNYQIVKFNYADILKKVEKRGWKKSDIQIECFTGGTDGKNPFWQIIRINKGDVSKNITLRIDAITGKEKQTKEQMIIVNFTDTTDSNKVTGWVW